MNGRRIVIAGFQRSVIPVQAGIQCHDFGGSPEQE